jgi:hypothetical protein
MATNRRPTQSIQDSPANPKERRCHAETYRTLICVLAGHWNCRRDPAKMPAEFLEAISYMGDFDSCVLLTADSKAFSNPAKAAKHL